jgi:ribosome-associated protein
LYDEELKFMEIDELRDLVVSVLEDMKATDVAVLDVRDKTSIADYFVIASGTSDRHVKSSAEAVAFQAKLAGEAPLGVEGLTEGEWALVDLNGVVVHVMQAKVRDFYQLEKLWAVDAEAAEKLARERGR